MFFRTLIVGALLACAAPSAGAVICDARCRVDTILTHNVGIALDKPVTLSGLRKLAPLKSDRTKTRPNPNYPGKTDTLHVLAFDGLFVRAAVTPENQVVVEWIELTGAKPALPFGLALNARTDVRAILGPPDRVSSGTVKNGEKLIYSNEERTQTASFIIQNGLLVAVIWDFGAGD